MDGISIVCRTCKNLYLFLSTFKHFILCSWRGRKAKLSNKKMVELVEVAEVPAQRNVKQQDLKCKKHLSLSFGFELE